MIVITGSTGHVGRIVAEELARGGHAMRLIVRNPTRAPRLANTEVVVADYDDAAALRGALRKGDSVFMVSVHEGPELRIPLHRSFVEAAASVGVAHVVYLSFVNAGPTAIFLHARSHGATEEILEYSGVPFTAIRNGMYADDIPTWFDARGVNTVPGGDGRMSFSYRHELAEMIAAALSEPGHEGKVYNVTTPESVSMRELADIASETTGEGYRYEPVLDAEWEVRWRARGKSDWEIEAGLTSYAALRSGELDVVSDDYRAITGRDPLSIADLIARYAAEMPLSS